MAAKHGRGVDVLRADVLLSVHGGSISVPAAVLCFIVAVLLSEPRSCAAQSEMPPPVEEYVSAIRSERPDSEKIATLRGALLRDPQRSMPLVVDAIRAALDRGGADANPTIRSLCSLVNDIAKGADAPPQILTELGRCAPIVSITPDRIGTVFPIFRVRVQLGDESAVGELVLLAMMPSAPAWVRVQAAEVLPAEDNRSLTLLREVAADSHAPLDDRVSASLLLARRGDDSDALQFALRLAAGEAIYGDTMEGGRRTDGYAILCEVSKHSPEILRKVLTDLTAVDDLFVARVILRSLADEIRPGHPAGQAIVDSVREYVRRALAGNLELDADNLSLAIGVLRKSGIVSDDVTSALGRRIDALWDATPTEPNIRAEQGQIKSDTDPRPPTPDALAPQGIPEVPKAPPSPPSDRRDGQPDWTTIAAGLATALVLAVLLARLYRYLTCHRCETSSGER